MIFLLVIGFLLGSVNSFYINSYRTTIGLKERNHLKKFHSTELELSTDSNIIKRDYKKSIVETTNTIWNFSRPHTVIGSILSIISLFTFATPPLHWIQRDFLKAILLTIIPSTLINVYITGLNQITDVDIDKINKPYLPIASGQLSKSNAILIVLLSLFIGSYMGLNQTWPLQMALYGSIILGTIYSLPPFRLKR
jgi:homogentisate phytyltransferase/homogentisate geranylgeranyltransferase